MARRMAKRITAVMRNAQKLPVSRPAIPATTNVAMLAPVLMSLRRRAMSAENFGGRAALDTAAVLSNHFVLGYVGHDVGLLGLRGAPQRSRNEKGTDGEHDGAGKEAAKNNTVAVERDVVACDEESRASRNQKAASVDGGLAGGNLAGGNDLTGYVGELRHHDGAGRAKELAVAGTSLVDALKLGITLLDALAALVAEVDEAFGAAVGVGVDTPTAGRALRVRASAAIGVGHVVGLFGEVMGAAQNRLTSGLSRSFAAYSSGVSAACARLSIPGFL